MVLLGTLAVSLLDKKGEMKGANRGLNCSARSFPVDWTRLGWPGFHMFSSEIRTNLSVSPLGYHYGATATEGQPYLKPSNIESMKIQTRENFETIFSTKNASDPARSTIENVLRFDSKFYCWLSLLSWKLESTIRCRFLIFLSRSSVRWPW
jgi:hypothetical protein